jgi:hypothetical protein
MQISKQKLILALAVLVVVFGSLSVMRFYRSNSEVEIIPDDNKPVACPMDARVCPDGSTVGRSGPSCEFALCPGTGIGPGSGSDVPDSGAGSAVGLNRQFVKDGITIVPLEVVSDSRCPMNARCIWAGEVEIKVGLSKAQTVQTTNLKLGGSAVYFEGKAISLVSVSPEKTTTSEIPSSNYRFVFEITQ